MTILVSGGDSFTFGAELPDQSDANPSKLTIASLLAKNAGMEYECVAVSGNSNTAITRQVMNACSGHTDADICVFVMWTFTHRYEFRYNYDTGRKTSPWHSMNLWDIIDDIAEIKSTFSADNTIILNEQLSTKYRQDRNGMTKFIKSFYTHIGNNEFYEIYSSLKEIVFLQNYLKMNSIKYIFTVADDTFRYSDSCGRHTNDVNISSLYNQIDWDKWYFFPAGNGDANQTNTPRGFYQWAKENKYRIGTTHPLEDAHYDASLLIQEKFDELVTKHL